MVTGEVLTRLYGHHVDVLHVHGRILVVAGAADDGAAVDGSAGHEAAATGPAAGVG